jgi:hypothetical protein
MPNPVYPDGTQLVSSALSPDQAQQAFQHLIAEILGYAPDTDPATAYYFVRVGWQQEGQPAWKITEDVCTLHVTLQDDPYARVRDNGYEMTGSPADVLTNVSGSTQIWKVALLIVGPNCALNARLILTALAEFDWASEELSAQNLYPVVAPPRPIYSKENFQGQWWPRADVEFLCNEAVTETLAPLIPAESVDVTVYTDTGLTTEIPIGTP